MKYCTKKNKKINMAGKKVNEKNCNVFIEDTLDVEVKEIID